MSYIGGSLPGQEQDQEYPQDIGKETFQKGIKSISDTYQKLPEPVKKNVSEASRFGGEIFSGLAEMNREARESNILGLGPLDPLIGATKLYDKAIEGVSDITGIYRGYFDLADFFIPATPTALKFSKRLSTTKKAAKVTTNLNDLKAFSFATKVDNLTGSNVKSEVMQMLYKADNMEDVFSGQTLKTIKNIQEQYPITPTKHGANLPSYITATSARARNKALKAKGITKYKDELGHFWRLEGSTKQQYRNITFRDAERQATNPFTGKLGGRYTATRKAANLRTRDLKASSAEEAKYIADIEATKARINRELNLKPSDANYMTLEHRIAQNDWKKWNLPGNPHDSANLWLSTKYEASIKTKIENIIRTTKRIKQRYVVDFNPQNNALHVMKFDEFKLNDLPKGKRFKKNKKGEYNVQEIERYLKTLE